MAPITDPLMDEEMPRARLGLLLQHFSELDDDREPWRVMYPLKEVLLLVTCATIASCDDFDDIVAWGRASSRRPAAVRGVPPRHSLRTLAARARQSDRSYPVRAMLRELGGSAVAGAARVYRY